MSHFIFYLLFIISLITVEAFISDYEEYPMLLGSKGRPFEVKTKFEITSEMPRLTMRREEDLYRSPPFPPDRRASIEGQAIKLNKS